jgi:hypothetical protein
MKRYLIPSLLSLLVLSSTALLPLAANAQVGVSISVAPPPLRYEAIPPARSGYAWVPGFWNWDGRGHVWVSGHYEINRPGYVYQRSEWRRDGNGWRLAMGGWQNNGGYSQVQMIPAPPAPRWERTPHARRGYIWSPGHWAWQGNRHEWVTGVWIAERPGYVYTAPSWSQRDGRWEMDQGQWRRHDRDHDGIPDRYDRNNNSARRDQDRDGVPDRFDKDRDGDGIPNGADRRPDNARR